MTRASCGLRLHAKLTFEDFQYLEKFPGDPLTTRVGVVDQFRGTHGLPYRGPG